MLDVTTRHDRSGSGRIQLVHRRVAQTRPLDEDVLYSVAVPLIRTRVSPSQVHCRPTTLQGARLSLRPSNVSYRARASRVLGEAWLHLLSGSQEELGVKCFCMGHTLRALLCQGDDIVVLHPIGVVSLTMCDIPSYFDRILGGTARVEEVEASPRFVPLRSNEHCTPSSVPSLYAPYDCGDSTLAVSLGG